MKHRTVELSSARALYIQDVSGGGILPGNVGATVMRKYTLTAGFAGGVSALARLESVKSMRRES